MAMMARKRSRTLHNFSLPSRLSWGAQRLLRCSKVDPNDGDKTGHYQASERSSRESSEAEGKWRLQVDVRGGGDDRDTFKVLKEKLVLDLHREADKMKAAILSDGEKEIGAPPVMVSEAKPWNLRTRRSACLEPRYNGEVSNGGGTSLRIVESKPSSSPLRTQIKSLRNGGVDEETGGVGYGEKRPRAKFSVSLSRQEIVDDLTEMMGKRPPRRPKKRPKCVQRQLDALFPGFGLLEITADMYRVNEILIVGSDDGARD
ncbi:hypothetical protein Nepgr_025104 [Nepenthes gracilis]|uniref:Uncharacterized protein n=1 Tax=Nepenthes gracilis TaxID=150966 RepID=A0AAD3T623_NEPGR|nr:hypothetical protein Nepgr_025104 [Nepenthes gracilis]